MDNNIPSSESNNNDDLANRIENGDYDKQENKNEVYNAPNGMKIKITGQAGADQMTDWLREKAASNTNEAEDKDFNHANELRINELANEGMSPRFVSPEMTSALASQDELAEKARADARHQEEIDRNRRANDGFNVTKKNPDMASALASQDELAEKAKADARHQEEIDRNRRANDGFNVTKNNPDITSALASQDELAEKAKADARHQEALNSNTKANEGFTGGMTQTGRNALHSQDTIAELAKENARLKETTAPGTNPTTTLEGTTPEITTTTPVRDLHQEALDRNTKANEGFTGSMTQTGRNALHSQDTIAELAKENARLQEEKELTPEQQELKEIKVLIKEQSVQIQQLILIMQQNITNIHNNTVINGGGAPITEPTIPGENGPVTPEVPLTPEQQEIVDIKIAVTQQSEQINQLIAIMQQTNNININNINGAGTNPTEGADGPIVVPPAETTTTTTTQETTPVTPEVTTPETRRKLKVAYIAGAVIGGSTGILGGVPAAGIGALVCIAGGILNTGLNKWSNSNVERWNRRLATVTDPAERTKLEKRVADWGKVKKFTETTASDFLRGARHGLLASSIFSGVFLGGHGLAWNTPEPIISTPTANPTGTETGTGTGTGTETGGGTGGGTGPETYQGNDFIDKNGQIHADGSPWDNRSVVGPEGNLPGGAENASNYTQGQWGRTPSVVNDFLKQNNITDTSYLDSYDRDRILDETWLAIKGGNTNPDMTQILKHIGTDGTSKLLAAAGN